MKLKLSPGFTMMELLIAMTLIGILTTIVVPSYQRYTRKAYYMEIIQATIPLKLAVEECYQFQGTLNACSGGQNGIPNYHSAEAPTPGGAQTLIDTLTVNQGIITVTPQERHGITAKDTYILTPRISTEETILWTKSGGGIDAGYAQ